MPVYNGTLLPLERESIRRYAGLARAEEFPAALIEDAWQEVQILGRPRGHYQYYSYQSAEGIIQAPVSLRLTGGTVNRHLAKAVQVAVLAVTLGEEVETAIDKHFANGEYTAALLLDAAGTAAVECIADQVNALIAIQARKQGFAPVYRFSPGYGNWDVRSQAQVTALAGGAQIGIQVTPSSMLKPRKSVTAVIGLVPAGLDTHCPQLQIGAAGCEYCTQVNCSSRKIPGEEQI